MTHRYTLLIGLAAQISLLHAQTVLTTAEYASLKGHDALPEGAIVISDAGTPASGPADWLLARGGGGACGCWIEPDGDYTVAMPENDDLSSAQITLPFTFSLFGDTYTTLYINNNGNVSFDNPYGTYTADPFPTAGFYMVAPFWADVDTRDTLFLDSADYLNGQVLYRITDHALYVNWVDVGYYSMQMDKRNSFQMIITDGTDPVIPGGNNVSFCYGDMQWTTGTASGGIDGFGGVSATVGVNKGDGVEHAQVGRFNSDDNTYNGAYEDSSGVHWLDSTHFYMNTMGTGIPPIFGSTFDCDTVIVQMPMEGADDRDGEFYQLIALPGAPDELVNCTSDAPTLPNFENINAGFSDKLLLEFQINADEAEVGLHYITFTATNDDAEPLSSTYVLQVEKTGTGSNGILANAGLEGIALVPNPALESSTLTWPADVALRNLVVLGLDGKQVASFSPTAREQRMVLPLEGLAPGTYLVRAIAEEGVFTSRLVRVAR